MRTKITHSIILAAGLILGWHWLISALSLPAWILPKPGDVALSLYQNRGVLLYHSAITATEILLGTLLGVTAGITFALALLYFRRFGRWLLPVLIISQAIPTFALAPVLMLWLGYGLASKVAMAAIALFFPVTMCCYDGLRHTQQEWLDLAQTMGATPYSTLRFIRWPAALPVLAAGLRIAVVIAPIGAVVGEWVGSSAGLGYYMLQANARLMISELFAALVVLASFTIIFYLLVDWATKRLVPWQPETTSIYQ